MRIARNILKAITFATIFVTVLLSASLQARSQEAAAPYLKMAHIDQYLIADRNAEIAMHVVQRPHRFQRMPKSWCSDRVDMKLPSKARMVSSALWSDHGCPHLTFRSSGIQRCEVQSALIQPRCDRSCLSHSSERNWSSPESPKIRSWRASKRSTRKGWRPLNPAQCPT